MPKRKASDEESGARRSSRRKTANQVSLKEESEEEEDLDLEGPSPKVKSKSKKAAGKAVKKASGKKAFKKEEDFDGDEEGEKDAKKDINKTAKTSKAATSEENGEPTGQQYWLMKAEPESRLEKGKDMKFSIDDLASKTEPEPWDGIRNYVARNNLRAMKKGDLAFFYHSNCKVPGIVGVMEIVAEHSPDLTARDPSEPYYDPKDTGDEPRWSVVHVEFRQKFDQKISLPELKKWHEKGEPLEGMQMLNSARLSVSRVSKGEWEFLMGVVEERKGGGGGDEV